MYNYDDFGTHPWQSLRDFVCNSEVSVPMELFRKAGHRITSDRFRGVERPSSPSSMCAVSQMTDKWLWAEGHPPLFPTSWTVSRHRT